MIIEQIESLQRAVDRAIARAEKAEAERDRLKGVLDDLLQTVFLWRDGEPYFRTHGGIPMEIAERYVRIIKLAHTALEDKP